MIRHIFLWKVASGADPDEIIRVLNQLSRSIPGIRRWEIGKHQGPLRYASTFEYGMTADFDSLEQYEAYSEHPEHQNILPVLAPMFAARAVLDLEISD